MLYGKWIAKYFNGSSLVGAGVIHVDDNGNIFGGDSIALIDGSGQENGNHIKVSFNLSEHTPSNSMSLLIPAGQYTGAGKFINKDTLEISIDNSPLTLKLSRV